MSRFNISTTSHESSPLLATAEVPRSALIPLSRRIQNLTNTAPVLLTSPPPQHGPFWTCPKTGIVIPKTLDANLKWRRQLLNEAAFADHFQNQLRAACAASAWFWI